MKGRRLLIVTVMLFVSIGSWMFVQSNASAFHSSISLSAPNSPLPTATPLPVVDIAVSPEAQLALNYVAKQQKIEPNQLVVADEEAAIYQTLGLTYTFVMLFYDQPGKFQEFGLLVDPRSGQVIDDLNAVSTAEQEAYQRKYGKLHPELYELLQTTADDEKLPVAIWVAPSSAVRDEAELAADFIKLHPEAEQPWLEQGMPWAVDDPKLRDMLKMEWQRMQLDELSKGNQPIVEWLEARGYSDIDAYGTPSVTATVSKLDILTLAQMESVDQIYFVGHEEKPAVNVAVPTDRIPTLWARGVTGAGVARLAIVETGKINTQAAACLNIIGVRDASLGDSIHKS